VGVLLFKNIFSIAPEAVELFSFKNESNVYESPKLKAHGAKVASTVGTAVAGLQDINRLVPVLQALGLRHAGYNVTPAHYDVVGKALIETLRKGLQADFTPDVEAAWTAVYGLISSTMMGAKEQMQKDDSINVDDSMLDANGGPLSDDAKALVEASWAKVAALGAEEVGVLLFKNIFSIAPEAVELFSFKNESNVYESPKLKAHGAKVASTVGTAVAGLQDINRLVPVLQALGLRHAGYNVTPAHYDVVGKALIETLRKGLQADFTPDVEAAWTAVYGLISSTMMGAKEQMQKDENNFVCSAAGICNAKGDSRCVVS